MSARKASALRAADPADPAFTMAHSPFYWIARVIQRYTRDMDAVLKRVGMDVPRWRVLMILVEINPASVTQLAEHGVMKLSTMTKTVQRLELDGFVATRPRESDARVTEVIPTAKGRKVVGVVRAVGAVVATARGRKRSHACALRRQRAMTLGAGNFAP